MRILLSAFAFAPGVGSEAGGAWRWAAELSRQHQVVVVTDISRRERCEPVLAQSQHPQLTVHYYRPRFLCGVRLNSWTAQLLFGCWQLGLLAFARRLHRQEPFDLVHHLTYGTFRQASWLGFVGPPFVFGPVGGGEDAPWRLKASYPIGEKIRDAARMALNWLAPRNPLWRLAINRATLVIARTPETRACLPPGIQTRTFVAQETGAPASEIELAPAMRAGARVELLFAGRLLGLKGVQFAIGATAKLHERGRSVRLTVIGSGPMAQPLRRQAERLRILGNVRFVPHLPQQELFAQYCKAHVFVFPSLRDAGGNVVQEALAAGLPVVCLDLGGPPSFVDPRCGEVVAARDAADEAELSQRIADAIDRVTASPETWLSFHRGALARASELTWERQISRIQARIQEALL